MYNRFKYFFALILAGFVITMALIQITFTLLDLTGNEYLLQKLSVLYRNLIG